jgi:hypothetical protein
MRDAEHEGEVGHEHYSEIDHKCPFQHSLHGLRCVVDLFSCGTR